MNTIEIATVRFSGGRFQNHEMPIDSLKELERFQALLIETAKAIWHRQYPERKKLPDRFEDRFKLNVRSFQSGSTLAPLVWHRSAQMELEPIANETAPDEEILREAIKLIGRFHEQGQDSIDKMDWLSPKLIHKWSELGSGLKTSERMQFGTERKKLFTVSQAAKTGVDAVAQPSDIEHKTLVGVVVVVDVERMTCKMRMSEKSAVEVPFDVADMKIVVMALRNRARSSLNVSGRFDGTRFLDTPRLQLVSRSDPEFDPAPPPIEDVIDAISATVDEGEWVNLPHDLSDRFDNYVYGATQE